MGWPVVVRIAVGLAAAALLCLGLYAALWTTFGIGLSAQAPDPFVATGDPCCGHPDDWGQVAAGIASGVGMAAVVGMLLGLAGAFGLWAIAGRWPSLRRFALVPLATVCAAGVLATALLVPELGEGRTGPSCDGFRLRGEEFRSTSDDVAKKTAMGIVNCRSLSGRTAAEVSRRLGSPSTKETYGGGRSYWSYDYVDLIFERGRVIDADFPD